MKYPLRSTLLLCLATGIAGYTTIELWHVFRERTLTEPFMGVEYRRQVPDRPHSSLNLPGGEVVQVFWDSKESDPLLCLRTKFHTNAWCRQLKIEQVMFNGATNQGKIKRLELIGFRRSTQGYKVQISCDWDWGGDFEWGLIYLDRDSSFRGVALSW